MAGFFLMTRKHRGLFLATLSISVLALAACSTTGRNANMTNQADASRVDSMMDRAAREAKANGNSVESIAILEKLYSRNKDDAAIATSYGQALREDDQLNKARQVLVPFTSGKKAYPDAVTELAMVQLGLGQYKEAELTSKRAIELDPKSGRAYLALGTAQDALNYHEAAEDSFRKGTDNWKGDPSPILNNLALNLASQNKLDQALAILDKAKQISPGRMDIERNYRIISTLKESADDFIIKQKAEKEGVKAPDVKPADKQAPEAQKKELPPKEESKKPDSVSKTDEKTVKKAAEKAPAKKSDAKIAPQPSKKTQNFNRAE